MAKSRVPSPQQHLSIKRFDPVKVGKRTYNVGDEVLIRATITRTGLNTWGTSPTVTIRIEGTDRLITDNAETLLGREG